MAQIKNKPRKQSTPAEPRKPWLEMKSAVKILAVVSIVLAVIVAYQIIRGSGDWGQGILWGLIFGSSVWIVFFGMNFFHSLFNGKK